jgi:pimeloyl-ACP methyl ester carboxylesterase
LYRTKYGFVLGAVLVGLTALVGFPVPGHADGGHRHGGNRLHWTPCFEEVTALNGVTYECADYRVPLDYSRRGRRAIGLSLVRIPASDPTTFRGSLFLNPGGPGGSGVDFVVEYGPFAPLVWGPVANQFDLIGFDPRGIARSTALRCFDSLEEALEAVPPIPFPVVEEEIALFEEADELLNEACDEDGTLVLNHMSTANVARDLDLLRRAVGDRVLNYVGLSYGSYLGQTYANLFPYRVGAFVIDGVLDPYAWVNIEAEIPFSTAMRSDAGAQATLDELFRQCEAAEPGNCALAPDAAQRFADLLERLQEGPITLTDPVTGETFDYSYAFLVVDVLNGLYNPGGYAALAEFLAYLELAAEPLELGLARERMQALVGLSTTGGSSFGGPRRDDEHGDKGGRDDYLNIVEGRIAVACTDSSNPTGGHAIWFEAAEEATEEFGIFADPWTWFSSPCAVWSHFDDDVYQGPFETTTRTPSLVIGNLYDPATRYEGALTARELLQGSVLLSVDEPGHTSLGLSPCAGALTGLYLEDPTAYALEYGDFTCPSGGNWFDLATSARADAATGMGFRARLMGHIAFRP